MKALSVRQPWAELIACGRKPLEVRSRPTYYRGPLLVCSSLRPSKTGTSLHGQMGAPGVAVCVVDLVDCRPLTTSDAGGACCPVDDDVAKGAFAWVLSNPRRVEATPIKGSLSFFHVETPIVFVQ